MKKTKLSIIGTAGLPSNYGGFETLAEHLTAQLGDALDITVYCSARNYRKEDRRKTHNDAKLVYLPFKANGLQSIIYDSISILHALFKADVLLVLGVSAGILLPFIRFFTGKKIITSIDGLEWKRNKWSKWVRWYLWLSEWCAVKASHANIADNESIQDYTAMRYNKLSTIIEYGADHVAHVAPQAPDYRKYPFLKGAYAVKVCRIEPENNIGMVLEAFSQLPAYNLVLVGNWNNSDYASTLRRQYQGYKNIFMLDPIYDHHEINMLRSNAAVYIHGHSAGGTNPSLIEAMFLKLPIIAFGVNYNKTTTENSAFYFKNAQELMDIISNIRMKALMESAHTMGVIARRRYRWEVIAEKYYSLIHDVAANRAKSSLTPALVTHFSKEELTRLGISHLQSTSMFYEKR